MEIFFTPHINMSKNTDKKTNSETANKGRYIMAAIVIAIITCIILIGFMFYYLIMDLNESIKKGEKIKIEKYNICSLVVDSEVTGSTGFNFILSKKRIEKDTYFITYKVLKDGGKVIYKMPEDKVILYNVLEKNEQSYVEISINGYGNEEKYKVYVPKDVIVEEYDLSLDNLDVSDK